MLRISSLEDEVKKLAKTVVKLEKVEEDNFELGNLVRLKDKNDTRILEVAEITAESLWLRYGKTRCLKRQYNVEKIDFK